MSNTPVTIATIPKNNFQEIRVGIVMSGVGRLVDVRLYDLPKPTRGEPAATRSGFCFAADRLPALIEALQLAEREVSQ